MFTYTEHLIEILEEQEEREIPENAPAPIMLRKTFKELGTPTVQAETLADQRLSMSSEVSVPQCASPCSIHV